MYTPGPSYNLASSNPKGTYEYCNWNFVFLSYFIQKLSGLALQDYVQINILDKVGISPEKGWFDPWTQAFEIKQNINKVSGNFVEVLIRSRLVTDRCNRATNRCMTGILLVH